MSELDLKPFTGVCPGCEGDHFVLAKDTTEYTPFRMTGDSKPEFDIPNYDESDEEFSIRVFCPECGTYFEVTDEVCP